MKIFSWNVNGLRAVINKGEFKKFIDKYQPDILCLQETKAKKGQVEIDLPDYEEFWNSADRPGYAGTAVFVKNSIRSDLIGGDIKSPLLRSDLIDGYGNLIKEGRIMTMEFDKFYLVNVYTPNAKDDLSRLAIREKWDAAFLKYLKELNKKKSVICCGDLNVAHREIDVTNPKTKVGKHGFTDEERAGFQNFLNAGYLDIFRVINGDILDQYTFWSYLAKSRERNVGWRIDYFLVSKDIYLDISSAKIHPEQMGSDHCPISIDVRL